MTTSGLLEPALFASFYADRRQESQLRCLRAIHERLYRALSEATSGPVLLAWSSRDTEIRCFEVEATTDTIAVQVAQNYYGDTLEGWTSMRRRLEAALPDEWLLRGIWGYTLIYQARRSPAGQETDILAAMPAARQLHAQGSPVEPLRRAELPGGSLWLMDSPEHGDGFAAGMVYLALSPPSSESDPPHAGDPFVQRFLYGPGAALLMPDLITHKGFFQIRQFRLGPALDLYYSRIDEVWKVAEEVLGDLGRQPFTTNKLDDLTRAYRELVIEIPSYNELRVGLLQQFHNFDRWLERVGNNPVFAAHRNFLEGGERELQLIVESGRELRELVATTTAMAQVRQTEQLQEAAQRERTQREIHTQRLNTIALLVGLPVLGLTFVSTAAGVDSWRLAAAGSVVPFLLGVLFLALLRRGHRASTTEPRPATALPLTPNRHTDEEADSRSLPPSS